MTVPAPEFRARRAVRVVVLIVAAFLLQTLVRPSPWIEGVAPDFILAAVFAVAVRRGTGLGIGLGVGAGLLQDSFSGGLLGVHGSSKPLVAFLTARVAQRRRPLAKSTVLVLALFAAVMDAAALLFLTWVTGAESAARLRAVAFGIPITAVAGWTAARVLQPPAIESI